MGKARATSLVLAALLVGGALLAGAFADDAGRTPVPSIPKGKGGHCVRDVDFMRRDHMTMLKHQRDDTVHEGVRGDGFSIKACVECHAVDGSDGQPVSYADPKHFCRSCHSYASVTIDCFECHASKPTAPAAAARAPHAADASELAALQDYLRGAHP